MPTEKEWIQTFTGKKFWPLNPRMEDIDIEDIAHALSMQCRFTGHVSDFYSVAQHSVLVSELLSPDLALWGLLHDASEAYLADVSRPVKHADRMEAYRDAEKALMRKIALKLGLGWPMPPAVKRADNLMLITEAHALKSPLVDGWKDWGFPDAPLPCGPRIECWSWRRAKAEFLLTFMSLTGDKYANQEINVG